MAAGIAAKHEEIRALELLGESKGWLLLSGVMQEQMNSIQDTILFTPLPTLDRCLEQEYKKGTLDGKLSWEQLRVTTIEVLQSEINTLKELEEDASDSAENENGNNTSDESQPTHAP